jgi:soluble lytic murein transglycosylase
MPNYSDHRISKLERVIRFGTFYALLSYAMSVSIHTQAAESDFLDAQRAAKSRDLVTLDLYRQQMQGDALAPYPEYWQLNNNLVTQSPDAIKSFLDRYPNSATGEKLVGDYIEAKARAGDFASTRQLTARLTNPDATENCALALTNAANGDILALSALRSSVWLATGKMADLCLAVADQLLISPLMTDDDRVQRLKTMLRAGQVSRALPVAKRLQIPLDASQLASIASSPLAYLTNSPKATLQDQMYYLYAIARLASSNPDVAVGQLTQDKDQLPVATTQYAYRILAMNYATNITKYGFDQRVISWFDNSIGIAFSDEEAEAYARSAIRFGEWNSLLHALDSLSIEKQNERIWRYWFARATEQRSDTKAKHVAKNFYTALAVDDDYYGLLARDRLGLTFNQLAPIYKASSADHQRLKNDINFQRAFTLRDINADAEFANREWNWAVRQAYLKQDDGMLIAAAEQANQISWFDRAIYAAERTTRLHNDHLLYLTPFRDLTEQYSLKSGLDPAWVYGLIRQESRFLIKARSSVGAGGLMQVMPSTAQWIAGRLGERYQASQLSDMDTNIRFGTFYLNHIHGQLSSQNVLATAGYNAGPLRAKRWQPNITPLAADQYTESIPFTETRDYVKQVMTNAVHYGLIFNQGAQSITQRMGTIPVRTNQDIVGP